uniref:Uncharacterized protein n=1 Tax=Naja naja TaxID=35670 RepID=A0A8C6XS24_NAJNA
RCSRAVWTVTGLCFSIDRIPTVNVRVLLVESTERLGAGVKAVQGRPEFSTHPAGVKLVDGLGVMCWILSSFSTFSVMSPGPNCWSFSLVNRTMRSPPFCCGGTHGNNL